MITPIISALLQLLFAFPEYASQILRLIHYFLTIGG